MWLNLITPYCITLNSTNMQTIHLCSNAAWHFRNSCLKPELKGLPRQLYRKLKIYPKICRIFLKAWASDLQRENAAEGGRERRKEKKCEWEKKFKSPLCWLCKSATSAAYFPPTALRRSMKPWDGTFSRSRWQCITRFSGACACPSLTTAWMYAMPQSGAVYSHTGCFMWQHDVVSRDVSNSQYMTDIVAANGANRLDQNIKMVCGYINRYR